MPKEPAPEKLIAALPAEKPGKSIEPATYRVVGLDENAKVVYFPEVDRSYVIADMTGCQLELLHLLGSPHIEKTPA